MVSDWMPLSDAERETLLLKSRLRDACVSLGLVLGNGTVCKRGAARYLTQHWRRLREPTFRGWLDLRQLNRRPQKSAVELLEAHVVARGVLQAPKLGTGT
jgi:hypothetical protein